MDKILIQTGNLLLAEPFMWDAHFRQSVILITDHHADGTHGFVLNRGLGMNINDLLAPFPNFKSEVHYGGPVATDTLHFLHNVGELLSDSQKVCNGLWWGGNFDELRFLVENELITADNIRFYVGYTGWEAGQLFGEITDGAWIQADGDTNYVFRSFSDNLWSDVLALKSDTFGVIGQIDVDTVWN